ncbi:hypothetical protein [Epilithonimonas hungarica]|uniref:Uncharacterized protein n=1 Tax=Epilithonimonas hungarica TaxID=454006 RepID=A0A1G7VKA3_9FLAO|nr:hypothetical protein [Epilithonimonas hungarica]SDG60173.1 hypothetical protein SAMN05421825_3662 [Epilithonimonas hungarica]
MIKIYFKNDGYLLFLLFLSINYYSQCTSCTVTNPTSSNYTFSSGSVVCFTTNTTLSDVTFENNSKICIAPGVTLVIQNNVNSANGSNVTFEIAGTLQFNQNPNINSNLTINIASGGTMRSGSSGNNNFTFSGTANTLTNRGGVDVGVLGFGNNDATNVIDNYGTYSITSNINISGTTIFRNFGTINVGQNFSSSNATTYINCGTMNTAQGYNLSSGRVINTGVFNVGTGTVDMGSNSRLENYGTFYSKGAINGSSTSSIYNEGLLKITTWQPNGASIKGPASSSKKGFVYVINPINPNGAKVGPNLDFTRYSQYEATMIKSGTQGSTAIFANAPNYINTSGATTTAASANVTFDCSAGGTCGASLTTNIGLCPNMDGSFPPIANSDNFAINAGASSVTSVLVNDLEQYNGVVATTSNVILTQVSTSNPNVTLNTSTGLVQVGSNVLTGNYTITYQICRVSLPSSCSTATVMINVAGGDPVCYKPAINSGTTLPSPSGITSLTRASPGDTNWPETRKGAWLVLESKTKGFVVNRLTTTQVEQIPADDLKEGMMVYNTTLNCLQINTDGTASGWKCFNTQACPD